MEAVSGVDAGAASSAAGSSVTQLIWVAQPVWAAGDPDINGGYCRTWRYVAATTTEEAQQLVIQGEIEYFSLYQTLLTYDIAGLRADVDCTGDPAGQVPAVVLRDAVRTVVTGQLPRPSPVIAPGFALPGLVTYLDTGAGHQLAYAQTETVTIGPFVYTVEVSAVGTTTVDWGDGTPVRTYDEPGRPYPEGTVTHTYRDSGQMSVVVTDTWVIDFRVVSPVALSDRVTAELQEVTIADFPVREHRAVRGG